MLTTRQREWRADKLGDLANYFIGALLVGQILSKEFNFWFTVTSLMVTSIVFLYSNWLLKYPR